MVLAWFMDDSSDDQRNDHHLDPPQYLDLEYLKQHGVLYWKIDADNYKSEGLLDKIKKDRGYNYEDIITISEDKLPNYHQKLKIFFEEHLHTDEEIRFIVDGSGFFDIRNKDDRWVRIKMDKGDLIILPAGIHHRFTLDNKNYIQAMRLFCGNPVWTPHNRAKDALHPSHEEYVKKLEAGQLK